VTFYNASHNEAPLGADVPILVSGELAAEKDSWMSLGGQEGRPVESLVSLFTAPEGFDMTAFQVNLGLAQRDMPSDFGSLINLNALPAQYLPRGVNWFNILAPVAAVLLIGVLVYAWTYIDDIKKETDTIQPKIDALQLQTAQEQAKLSGIRAQITQTDAAVTPIQSKASSLQSTYEGLRDQREMASGHVQNAWFKKPATTVTLESIDWDGETLVIVGTATTSESEVFKYATALRDTQRFDNVVVTEIVKRLTEDTKVYVYDFTLTLF